MSRTFLYGLTNGTPFQRSTITFDDVPMPSANRPGAASAIDGDRLRQQCRRPRVRRHDRRAQPQPGLPRRRQRQRREPVAAARLGRPDVGVAEVDELVQLLAVGVQVPGQGTVMPGRIGTPCDRP